MKQFFSSLRSAYKAIRSNIIWLSIDKLTNILKLFYLYLAFMGLFAFGLFLAEEATQVITWANFGAVSAQRYDLVLKNIDAIEQINNRFKAINKYCMWLNPFQQWGYGTYGIANDRYIYTMTAIVLAHEPALLIGRYINQSFKYDLINRPKNGSYELVNNRVKIVLKPEGISTQLQPDKYIHVRGLVEQDPGRPDGIIVRLD